MPGPGYRAKKKGGKGEVKRPKPKPTPKGRGLKTPGVGGSVNVRKGNPNRGAAPPGSVKAKPRPTKDARPGDKNFVGPVKTTPYRARRRRYLATFEKGRPNEQLTRKLGTRIEQPPRIKKVSQAQIRELRDYVKKNPTVGLTLSKDKKSKWGTKPIASVNLFGNKLNLHFGDRSPAEDKFLKKRGGKIKDYQSNLQELGVTEGKGKSGGKKSKLNPYGYKTGGKAKTDVYTDTKVGEKLGKVFEAIKPADSPITKDAKIPSIDLGKAAEANIEVAADNPGRYASNTARQIPATAAGIVGAPIQIAADTFTQGPTKAIGNVVKQIEKDVVKRYGSDKKDIKKQIEKEGGLTYLLDASIVAGGVGAGVGRAIGRTATRTGRAADRAGRPLNKTQELMLTQRPKLGPNKKSAKRQEASANYFRRRIQKAVDDTRLRRKGGDDEFVKPLFTSAKKSRINAADIYTTTRQKDSIDSRASHKIEKLANKKLQKLGPLYSAAGALAAKYGFNDRSFELIKKRAEELNENRAPLDPEVLEEILVKARGNKRESLSEFEAFQAFANDRKLFTKAFKNPKVKEFAEEARARDAQMQGEGVPGIRDIDVQERVLRPLGDVLGEDLQRIDGIKRKAVVARAKDEIDGLNKEIEANKAQITRERKSLDKVTDTARKKDIQETIVFLSQENAGLRRQIDEIKDDPDYNRRIADEEKTELINRIEKKIEELDLDRPIYVPEYAASRAERPASYIPQQGRNSPTKYAKSKGTLRDIGEVAADARLVPEGIEATYRRQNEASGLKRFIDDVRVSPDGKWLNREDANIMVEADPKGLQVVNMTDLTTDIKRMFEKDQLDEYGDEALNDWISNTVAAKDLKTPEDRYIVVDRVMWDEMQKLKESPKGVAKAFYKFNGWLTAAVLSTPAFLVANTLQNGLAGIISTKGGLFPILMRRKYGSFLKNISFEAMKDINSKGGITRFNWKNRRNLIDTSASLGLGNAERMANVLWEPFMRADMFTTAGIRGAAMYHQIRKMARGMTKHATEYMDIWQNPRYRKFWDLPDEESRMAYLIEFPELRTLAAEGLLDFMGNWTRYTYRERKLAGTVFMFYGFVRYATKLAFYTLPVDHPLMLSISLKFAQLHRDEMEDLFGEDYIGALGSIVVINRDGGVEPVGFDVSKLNPVAGPIFQAAERASKDDINEDSIQYTSSALLSGANPLIKTAFQGFTGKNAFTWNDMISKGDYKQGTLSLDAIPSYLTRTGIDTIGPTRMANQISEQLIVKKQQSDDSTALLQALKFPKEIAGVPKNSRAKGKKVSGKQARLNRERYDKSVEQVISELLLGFREKRQNDYGLNQARKKQQAYKDRKKRESQRNAGY